MSRCDRALPPAAGAGPARTAILFVASAYCHPAQYPGQARRVYCVAAVVPLAG